MCIRDSSQTQLHVVVFVDRFIAEARDLFLTANHQSQARGDVRRVNTEIRGAIAIDHDTQLGLVEFQSRISVNDAAEVLRALDQIICITSERDELRSTKYEVDIGAATSTKVERLRVAHTDTHRRVLLKSPAHFNHYVLLRVVSFEGVERMPFLQLSPE